MNNLTVKLFTPQILTKVKKVPGLLEQLANFPSNQAGGNQEAAGAPSTVNAPGTRVCVREQKCLCQARLVCVCA